MLNYGVSEMSPFSYDFLSYEATSSSRFPFNRKIRCLQLASINVYCCLKRPPVTVNQYTFYWAVGAAREHLNEMTLLLLFVLKTHIYIWPSSPPRFIMLRWKTWRVVWAWSDVKGARMTNKARNTHQRVLYFIPAMFNQEKTPLLYTRSTITVHLRTFAFM